MPKLLFTLTVFLFVYPIALNAIPFLSSRLLMALLGTLILIVKSFTQLNINKSLYINSGVFYCYIYLALIALISIISTVYNNTFDYNFVRFVAEMSVIFLGAFFLLSLSREINTEFLILTLIRAIALQAIISLALYVSPKLDSLIYSLVYVTTDDFELYYEWGRIIGFGRRFFSSGMYSGAGLMLIGYYIRYYKFNIQQAFFLTLYFFFIFVIGMMIARTTLIGAFLAVLLIVFPRKLKSISFKNIKLFSFAFFVIFSFIAVLLLLFPQVIMKYKELFNFAFELFINYFSSGELSTASTDQLKTMYIFPDSLKTWFIGDGKWSTTYGYYMSTDVGYLRLIYYFGIIGLLLFLTYNFILIKHSFNKTLPILFFITYILILNLKGYAELTTIFALLLLFNDRDKKKSI